jgi:hypothetical protein
MLGHVSTLTDDCSPVFVSLVLAPFAGSVIVVQLFQNNRNLHKSKAANKSPTLNNHDFQHLSPTNHVCFSYVTEHSMASLAMVTTDSYFLVTQKDAKCATMSTAN